MSNDLEESLRGALRPVDPGEKFAQRVMSRIESDGARGTQGTQGTHGTRGGTRASRWRVSPPPVRAVRWLSGALLATAAVVVLVVHEGQMQRTQQGLEAREQLIEALRVTGEKLDLAYRAVNSSADSSESGAGSGGNSGA